MGVGVGKQSRSPGPPPHPLHWLMSIEDLLSASPHITRPWDRHAQGLPSTRWLPAEVQSQA